MPVSDAKALSPWQYKPWWCQPWSIVLTSCVAIAGSWLLFRTIWVTVLVAIPVLAWMSFFIFLWPSLMRQSGLLETYVQSADRASE